LDRSSTATLYPPMRRKHLSCRRRGRFEPGPTDDRPSALLEDGSSSVLWDRSVSKVTRESSDPMAVGARFTTIGPSRGASRASDQTIASSPLTAMKSESRLRIQRSLDRRVWTIRLATKDQGTMVACDMDMTTSWLHAPVGLLLALNSKAVATDLQFLKRAIENGEVAKR